MCNNYSTISMYCGNQGFPKVDLQCICSIFLLPGTVGHQSTANPSTWCPVKEKTGRCDSDLYAAMARGSSRAARGADRSQIWTLPVSDHDAATVLSPTWVHYENRYSTFRTLTTEFVIIMISTDFVRLQWCLLIKWSIYVNIQHNTKFAEICSRYINSGYLKFFNGIHYSSLIYHLDEILGLINSTKFSTQTKHNHGNTRQQKGINTDIVAIGKVYSLYRYNYPYSVDPSVMFHHGCCHYGFTSLWFFLFLLYFILTVTQFVILICLCFAFV